VERAEGLSEAVVRVTAYTSGRNAPGARFRVRQYLSELRRHGLVMREIFSVTGAYPPAARVLRPFWGIGNLGEHLFSAAASYGSDVTFLQREFLSTLYTLEGLVKKPVVLDVDDAIWIHRDGRCARSLARLAQKVICGNSFLAEWFSRSNNNVEVVRLPLTRTISSRTVARPRRGGSRSFGPEARAICPICTISRTPSARCSTRTRGRSCASSPTRPQVRENAVWTVRVPSLE